MPSPIEYATSNHAPRPRSSALKARVNTAPSTGPTQGDQPAEKKTPISAEEA